MRGDWSPVPLDPQCTVRGFSSHGASQRVGEEDSLNLKHRISSSVGEGPWHKCHLSPDRLSGCPGQEQS